MNRLFDYVKRKRRQQLRQRIIKVWAKSAEAVSVLKNFNRIQQGRPCIEVDLLKLLSAIIKIIQSSTAADDRRRMECLCSISTLDDLHTELTKTGYNLSQSGLYSVFYHAAGTLLKENIMWTKIWRGNSVTQKLTIIYIMSWFIWVHFFVS